MKRRASALWRGAGLDGQGRLSTFSKALQDTPYSFAVRFQSEDGSAGTNPEELIAAAHAGCFNMALAFGLAAAGHTPTELRTDAVVTMEQEEGGWRIARSDLSLQADVPGLDEDGLREIAERAKAGCPVSRVLNAEITLTVAAPRAA